MEDDVKLYKKFLTGNNEAFNILIDKYRNNLIYFIQGFVNSKDIAEDLTQDVFVYVLINRKEYDFKYSLKTYLYTIAKSRALNYIKRERKIIPLENISEVDDEVVIEEKILHSEEKIKIHKAIKKLNPNQQRAIYLSDIEELSYKEICKILGTTIPQIKMTIYRARKNLRKILIKESESNG